MIGITILDSFDEHIAVLDGEGNIVATNRSWRRFGERNGLPSSAQYCLGLNYFSICSMAEKYPWGEEATAAAAGIRAVLYGELSEFHLEYPCHSPNEYRWFHMKVVPLRGGALGAVVLHEDISERVRKDGLLQRSKDLLTGVLDALPYFVCVLDGTGLIVFISQYWLVQSNKYGVLISRAIVGRNYLKICDSALGRDSIPSGTFATGIRAVLSGRHESYEQEYTCHQTTRRMIGRAFRCSGNESQYAVVTHQEITATKDL